MKMYDNLSQTSGKILKFLKYKYSLSANNFLSACHSAYLLFSAILNRKIIMWVIFSFIIDSFKYKYKNIELIFRSTENCRIHIFMFILVCVLFLSKIDAAPR